MGARPRQTSIELGNRTFNSFNRFVENHLPREAAMHRLGRVEAAGFEQLVRRRTAAAPAKIGAVARARADPGLNFGMDREEELLAGDV